MSHQQPLFDIEPTPWELDAAHEQLVATVVFKGSVEKTFDYSVPAAVREKLEPGRRVRVPFGRGNRMLVGYCVELQTRSNLTRRLKPVAEVVDDRTLLSPTMLRLTQWMADRYLCNWAQSLDAVLPAGVRTRAGTRRITLLSLAPEVRAKLPGLELSKKQWEIVRYLAASPTPQEPSEIAKSLRCTQGPITALRRKGILQATHERISSQSTIESVVPRGRPWNLNADQQRRSRPSSIRSVPRAMKRF